MQIVRTVVWVLILVVVLLFTLGNWDQQVTVRIWQNLVWDTRLPAVVIVSFLLGMLPMWLILRGTSWRLNRRIGHLEQATRTVHGHTADAGATATGATASAAATTGEPLDDTDAAPAPTPHPDGPRPLDPPRSVTNDKLKPE
ncbi:LapA family protein [Qipengyuania oceanensis]|uniref:DUF1049 domain-containing protein n=1 Tax=Qipengyuania oceanensis TaxID=1463597 RepID=A0A844YAI6_9SPHN|nr:LapA family protein [Qipengyuania oceanensis]MXO61946.1 DUF1049 domain-containing protein [Qipengyuania oceanensis]